MGVWGKIPSVACIMHDLRMVDSFECMFLIIMSLFLYNNTYTIILTYWWSAFDPAQDKHVAVGRHNPGP